jgi:hypothetical protein
MRKALIPAFLLMLGSVVLGATVLREPIAKAASPFTNVFVANTASNPVPVRDVNTDSSGNIKVHEQGTANVNVVDNREPFQRSFNINLSDGDFGGSDSFTVPAGKRLVVQYVAVSAGIPPNEGVSIEYSATGGAGTFAGVPIQSGGLKKSSAGDFVSWAGGGPVLAYSNAGQNFEVSLDRESSVTTLTAPGEADATVIATGYLEPSS